MKVNYYSIRDNIVGHYGWLVTSENDESVKRDAKILIDSDTIYGKSPEDFDLYFIGEFDDESADFKPELRYICCLRALKGVVSDEVSDAV